jgi:hypothetical protein
MMLGMSLFPMDPSKAAFVATKNGMDRTVGIADLRKKSLVSWSETTSKGNDDDGPPSIDLVKTSIQFLGDQPTSGIAYLVVGAPQGVQLVKLPLDGGPEGLFAEDCVCSDIHIEGSPCYSLALNPIITHSAICSTSSGGITVITKKH